MAFTTFQLRSSGYVEISKRFSVLNALSLFVALSVETTTFFCSWRETLLYTQLCMRPTVISLSHHYLHGLTLWSFQVNCEVSRIKPIVDVIHFTVIDSGKGLSTIPRSGQPLFLSLSDWKLTYTGAWKVSGQNCWALPLLHVMLSSSPGTTCARPRNNFGNGWLPVQFPNGSVFGTLHTEVTAESTRGRSWNRTSARVTNNSEWLTLSHPVGKMPAL